MLTISLNTTILLILFTVFEKDLEMLLSTTCLVHFFVSLSFLIKERQGHKKNTLSDWPGNRITIIKDTRKVEFHRWFFASVRFVPCHHSDCFEERVKKFAKESALLKAMITNIWRKYILGTQCFLMILTDY